MLGLNWCFSNFDCALVFVLQEAMYVFKAHIQGSFGECTVPNGGPAGGTNIPQTIIIYCYDDWYCDTIGNDSYVLFICLFIFPLMLQGCTHDNT